ncbi:hypothetical protein AUC71_10310 [Methyloceanibacter marginalis]|uniref:Uncharacterized protein n=1 Tax=Methyloceanibacter marginalis TaxID=1774971 RepID=A0A1E3WC47_9HYPH|nr:hypothetical protein AUC71_10310 [Methyloceanibacter marginalis]
MDLFIAHRRRIDDAFVLIELLAQGLVLIDPWNRLAGVFCQSRERNRERRRRKQGAAFTGYFHGGLHVSKLLIARCREKNP